MTTPFSLLIVYTRNLIRSHGGLRYKLSLQMKYWCMLSGKILTLNLKQYRFEEKVGVAYNTLAPNIRGFLGSSESIPALCIECTCQVQSDPMRRGQIASLSVGSFSISACEALNHLLLFLLQLNN